MAADLRVGGSWTVCITCPREPAETSDRADIPSVSLMPGLTGWEWGVLSVRERTFRAMVALDPSAAEDDVRRLLDGSRLQCVVQPCGSKCFPARISARGAPLPAGQAVDAVVHIPLLAGEAEAIFSAGKPFTVWADSRADDQTICGEGFLGGGVILSQGPAASPATDDQGPLPGSWPPAAAPWLPDDPAATLHAGPAPSAGLRVIVSHLTTLSRTRAVPHQLAPLAAGREVYA